MVPLGEIYLPSSSRPTKISKADFSKSKLGRRSVPPGRLSFVLNAQSSILECSTLRRSASKDQGICEFLLSLKVVFDTTTLLTKKYLLGAFKTYTGTPHFLPLKKKLKS